MPKMQASVLPEEHAKLKTVQRDRPRPGDDDILIKSQAVAINPLDWKLQSVLSFIIQSYPMVIGTDVTGVVVAVGSNVTKFKEGDRVASFAAALPLNNADYGGFQEYSLQKTFATVKLPDSISFEEGAVVPTAAATAAYSLYHDLDIARPSHSKAPAKEHAGFLIWGASSAVGAAMLQMAKAAGFTIYVTASAAHHETLKKIGADHVFDYRKDGVAEQVVQAAKRNGDRIDYGFDPIGHGNTSAQSATILAQTTSGKAHLGSTLPWAGGDQPESVQFTTVAAFELPDPKNRDLSTWLFNEWLPQALKDGTYQIAPQPSRVSKGLDSLEDALEIQKKGVSGKKIVVTLS